MSFIIKDQNKRIIGAVFCSYSWNILKHLFCTHLHSIMDVMSSIRRWMSYSITNYILCIVSVAFITVSDAQLNCIHKWLTVFTEKCVGILG